MNRDDIPPLAGTALAADDDAAIRRIVQDIEDAIVGTARGVWVSGREAIDEANRVGLASGFLRTATAYYEVASTAALAPGVAVAQKRAWSTKDAAAAGEPPEMIALYVLVRHDDGRWWIVRRQNTLVAA